jgi:hypothetical protein
MTKFPNFVLTVLLSQSAQIFGRTQRRTAENAE